MSLSFSIIKDDYGKRGDLLSLEWELHSKVINHQLSHAGMCDSMELDGW